MRATEIEVEHNVLLLGLRETPQIPQLWKPFCQAVGGARLGDLISCTRNWMNSEQPHVVHLHAEWAGLIGSITARFFTKERPIIVYEIHGAAAFESRDRTGGIAGWLRFAVLYLVESLAILLADRLVLVSSEITNYYPVAKLRPSTVVHRVVDDRRAMSSGGASDEIAGLRKFATQQQNEGRRVLVYSGGLSEWQLFEETVTLLSQVVGAGVASAVVLTPQADRAKEVVARHFVDLSRTFVARLAPQEVAEALEACDCGLLLRADTVVNRVASPTKFFEYLAAGLHVVTTRGAAAVAPLVPKYDLGLIVDLPHAELQLLEWLRCLERPRHEVDRIRDLVHHTYTWSASKESLLAMYSTPNSQGRLANLGASR